MERYRDNAIVVTDIRPIHCQRKMHSHGISRWCCSICGRTQLKLPVITGPHPLLSRLVVDNWSFSGRLDILNNLPIIYLPNGHPHRNSGGWQYLARHIAMESTGKLLRRDEHVHHDNGIKLDCRVSNLKVMLAENHGRHHARYQLLYMVRDYATGQFRKSDVPPYSDQIGCQDPFDDLSDIPF